MIRNVAAVMERFPSVMRNARAFVTIVAMAATLIVFLPTAAAAQGVGSENRAVRVFTTRSIATVLEKIGPDFERRTGRSLVVTTDVAVRMVRRPTSPARASALPSALVRPDRTSVL